MSRNKIEYPWLKAEEAIYYDDATGVYHYEITCDSGTHRFYISTKTEPRPITRELIDEYISILGLMVTCEETHEQHEPVFTEPTIEYNPETHSIIVNDGKGNETIHPMPEDPAEYHTLRISVPEIPKAEGYSMEHSLTRWSQTLFCATSLYAERHEYLKVAGYDKIIIVGDMIVVYTGEDFEIIKIPEDKYWSLIMSTELCKLLREHKQKAG